MWGGQGLKGKGKKSEILQGLSVKQTERHRLQGIKRMSRQVGDPVVGQLEPG